MQNNQLKEFAGRNRELFLGNTAAPPDVEQFLEKCKAEKNVARLYAEQKRERREKRLRIVSIAASIVVIMAVTLLAFPETRAFADRVGAVIAHFFTGETEEVNKVQILLLLPDTVLIESKEENNQALYSQYQYKDGTKIEILQEESDTVSRLLSDQYTNIKYDEVLGSKLEYVPDVDGYIGQFRFGERLVTIMVHSDSEDFFLYVVNSIRTK